MTNDSRETTLERNVGRMIRRWADPLAPERVDDACRDFLRRLAAPAPEAAPKSTRGGRIGFAAAALLLTAVTFWAIFAWRDGGVAPSKSGAPAGPVQADDDAEIRTLISKLGSAGFEEQGRAAEALERFGVRAVPALERATKVDNVQIRDWAGKILERIRQSDATRRAEVADLLRRLTSDDFAEQGRAAEAIRKLGKEAVEPLKLAREKSKDPKLTEWIDKLLAAIEKADPARHRETAVLAALKWLARHQGPDGGWGAVSFQNQCIGPACTGTGEQDHDTGLTALSILAFLGAGYSTLSKDSYPDTADPQRELDFGDTVRKGIQWLLSHQDPEGCVGPRGIKYMYNHAIATLCLSDAYGLTATKALKQPAQKAVDFLVAAQNPGKGWRYSSKSGDNDTSVTSWAVLALKSAQLSELQFPQACTTGALNWLAETTSEDGSFQTGYNARGTGKVFIPGSNESFVHHPTMSAIAVVSRIFMGQKKNEPAMAAVNLLIRDLPEWNVDKIDFYYWYHGSLALFQYDGFDGPLWKIWNEPMKTALLTNQKVRKEGCRSGSWDPELERWRAGGGRIYVTAIGALTLETTYRYQRVWEQKK